MPVTPQDKPTSISAWTRQVDTKLHMKKKKCKKSFCVLGKHKRRRVLWVVGVGLLTQPEIKTLQWTLSHGEIRKPRCLSFFWQKKHKKDRAISQTFKSVINNSIFMQINAFGRREGFATAYRKETNSWTNRLVVAKEEGEGGGWTGSLGLVDANYCIWSG